EMNVLDSDEEQILTDGGWKIENRKFTSSQPSITLTPELKAAVLGTGQPLYGKKETRVVSDKKYQESKKRLDFKKDVGKDVSKPTQDKIREAYKKDLLYGLKQRALRFDNFKDFSHDYSISVNHGIYYHLTDNPDWTYRTDIGSRDMSSIAGGQILDPCSFMVAADLDYWDSTYNRDGDD